METGGMETGEWRQGGLNVCFQYVLLPHFAPLLGAPVSLCFFY